MTGPLVVCVTPFFGRASLFSNVLGCFESQDYPNRILLVSNDTGIGLEVASPADVRVLNTPVRFPSLGAKRNHMREMAISLGAKYVSHWDDDDFYCPSFLREGVAEMERTRNLACRPCPVGYGTNIQPRNNNLWDGDGLRIRTDARTGIPYDSFFMCSSAPYARYDDIGCGENLPFMRKAKEAGKWSFYDPEAGPNCVYGWFRQVAHATNARNGLPASGEWWKLGKGPVGISSPENFGEVLRNVISRLTDCGPAAHPEFS